MGINLTFVKNRIALADYLSVAQLFLQSNFFLDRPLTKEDIKPRLLGHWGTCHGINVAYANLKAYDENIRFILGPGHGFPALQAQLFLDGTLAEYDQNAQKTKEGIAYICKNFSWPHGSPSHSSPMTPGIILEGGELGYCLATAYGAALNRPEEKYAVLIGDGEMETATLLASLNLNKLASPEKDGEVIPILHLNSYKISAPTIYGRISNRELHELIRGFGYHPIDIEGDDTLAFQMALADKAKNKFIIMRTAKGETGPKELHGEKIAGNYLSHQVPLPNAKTDDVELKMLERWLESYNFPELWEREVKNA